MIWLSTCLKLHLESHYEEYEAEPVGQGLLYELSELSDNSVWNYDEEHKDVIEPTSDILLNSYFAFLTQKVKLPLFDVHFDLFDISDEEHIISENNGLHLVDANALSDGEVDFYEENETLDAYDVESEIMNDSEQGDDQYAEEQDGLIEEATHGFLTTEANKIESNQHQALKY